MRGESEIENGEFVIVVCQGSAMVPQKCQKKCLGHSIWPIIFVTSFSSILYCSNSKYWSQKQAQSENIHSIMMDVYVGWQSTQNFPFLLLQRKLDKNLVLLL